MANRPGPDVGRSRPVLPGSAVAIGLGIALLLAAAAGWIAGRTLLGVLLGSAGIALLIAGIVRGKTDTGPPDEGVL